MQSEDSAGYNWVIYTEGKSLNSHTFCKKNFALTGHIQELPKSVLFKFPSIKMWISEHAYSNAGIDKITSIICIEFTKVCGNCLSTGSL